MPKYISALPTDPSLHTNGITDCTTYTTDYSIVADSTGRVTVSAPFTDTNEEGVGTSIFYTR